MQLRWQPSLALPCPVFFSLLGTVSSVPGVIYRVVKEYLFFQVGFRALFTGLETSNLLQFEAIVCQLNSSSCSQLTPVKVGLGKHWVKTDLILDSRCETPAKKNVSGLPAASLQANIPESKAMPGQMFLLNNLFVTFLAKFQGALCRRNTSSQCPSEWVYSETKSVTVLSHLCNRSQTFAGLVSFTVLEQNIQ